MKRIITFIITLGLLASCSNSLGYDSLKGVDNIFTKTTYSSLEKKVENKETFYLFAGRPTCEACQASVGTINKTAIDNGVEEIFYVNTDDLSKADNEKLFSEFKVSGTPALMMFKDGVMIDSTDSSVNPSYLKGSFTTHLEVYTTFFKANKLK